MIALPILLAAATADRPPPSDRRTASHMTASVTIVAAETVGLDRLSEKGERGRVDRIVRRRDGAPLVEYY